jgi:hypothetical protein
MVRRACAGKTMALDTIWIAIVSVLATFDIGRTKDEATGDEIVPEIKLNTGAIV